MPVNTAAGVDHVIRILITTGAVIAAWFWVPAVLPIPRPKGEVPHSAVALAAGLRTRAYHLRHVQSSVKAGAIAGGVLAFLINLFAPSLFWLLVIVLPPAVGSLAWVMSPHARSLRDEVEAEHEAGREKERLERDKLEKKQQQDQEYQAKDWTRRVMEACFWWTSEGRQLHSNPRFLRDYVRAFVDDSRRGRPSVARPNDPALGSFLNPDHPCATPARRQEIAGWVFHHRPDIVAEHLVEARRLAWEPHHPTPEHVAHILRLHFERDAYILREATALSVRSVVQDVRSKKEEPLPQRFKRSLQERDGVVVAMESAIEDAKQRALILYPNDLDKQEQHVAEKTEQAQDLAADEMRRRAGIST